MRSWTIAGSAVGMVRPSPPPAPRPGDTPEREQSCGVSLPPEVATQDHGPGGSGTDVPEAVPVGVGSAGGAVTVRDRVALWTLTAGVLAAVAAWRFVGPWPAMVVAVLAVLVACAAYRVERPRIDLDHLPLDEEEAQAPASASASATETGQ